MTPFRNANAITRRVVCAAVIVGLAAPAAAQACADQDSAPILLSTAAASASVLCLVNQRRHQAGVPGVSGERRLAQAARRHSGAMNSRNFFAHNSRGGSPLSRIQRTGYLAGASDWAIGENIRWGSGELGTPRAAVASWMASPPHRETMLSRRYRQVGVGVAIGSPTSGAGADAAIYTADFGSRQ
ncbi:MAG: CAP domain-containing protein [Actinomycetota bacterium]|nr:CAP domain-containing protein [Actinomycetota bacterium]